MDISKNWEKLILLLVALLTLGASVFTIKNSLAYGDKFEIPTVKQSDELPPMEKETVITSKTLVEIEQLWTLLEIPPVGGGDPRPIPLFKSITIVEIQGDLIDMSDPNAKKIRPPVDNQWLLDNELDFLSSNVLQQDPDGDEFVTLDEWNAKTLPRDPSSHPTFVGKLEFLARRQQNYIVEFSAQPDAERYQITRHRSSQFEKATFFMRKGETSPDQIFRIDKFEKKEAISNLGIKVDVSELSITYLPDEKSVKLVRRVTTTIPTYYGQFILTIGPEPEEFFVKKGATFFMPIDPETEYKLFDIDTEKAIVSFESEPGTDAKIEIRLKK